MSTYAGITFDAADAKRWCQTFGRNIDPLTPWDHYALAPDRDDAGLSSMAVMASGVYVVVDAERTVVYVGKVTRDDPGGLRDRFRRHHAARPWWAALWVLRFSDDCDAHVVLRAEARLIAAYQPVGNHQGVSTRARARRSGDDGR